MASTGAHFHLPEGMRKVSYDQEDFLQDEVSAEEQQEMASEETQSTSRKKSGAGCFWIGVFGFFGTLALVIVGLWFWWFWGAWQELPMVEATLQEFFRHMSQKQYDQAAALNSQRIPGELNPEHLRQMAQGELAPLLNQVPEIDINWTGLQHGTTIGHFMAFLADFDSPDGSTAYCYAVMLKEGEKWRICQLSLFPEKVTEVKIVGKLFVSDHEIARTVAVLDALFKSVAQDRRSLTQLFMLMPDRNLPMNLRPLTRSQLFEPFRQKLVEDYQAVRIITMRFRKYPLPRRRSDEERRHIRAIHIHGAVITRGGEQRQFVAVMVQGKVAHFRPL